MARSLTRAQALQNAAFLRHLRRTGNARLSAREIAVAYGTMQHRRKQHPGFAQRWDAAVAVAQARLQGREPDAADTPDTAHRTVGGEPVIVTLANGTRQVRRAQPGKITKACEQAFLSALSATCNMTLSAAAAGASPAAFYRRRMRDAAFAREMRLALKAGYERLQLALMESIDPRSCEDDAWRHNEPPPLPPMTNEQVLQLLYLHQKEARLWAERPDRRLRAGETGDEMSLRMADTWRVEQRRELEDAMLRLTARRDTGTRRSPHEPPPPALPPLDMVTGWSRADPEAQVYRPGVALFGGWRMEEMEGEG